MTSHGESGPGVAAPGASTPTYPAWPAATPRWTLTSLEKLVPALPLATKTAPSDQPAFREAMKALYENYDSVWSKERRGKNQAVT